MKVQERFLRYISYWTTSDETSNTTPSTNREFALAEVLKQELLDLGCSNVKLDDHCYVYALLPATAGYESKKAIGFISHMDTSPDASGENIKPQIIEHYDGTDIPLAGTGDFIRVKDFPALSTLKGRTLITTDGTTLLGADDKAGIAEILTALEKVITEQLPHGDIWISFTPDEELGVSADHFDLSSFSADYAYTVDGDYEGEIAYENFNAASAKVIIKGRNVHPGYAKDKMINSLRVANEFVSLLPTDEVPECTDGYQGFYHLIGMTGEVEQTTISYIIRDHDRAKFEACKENMKKWAEIINKKYGEGTVTLELKDQYYNMREKIEPVMHIIDIAFKAMEEAGVTPKVKAIRGGTDGAQLSFKGLPCPNIFAGGLNFHGRYEFVPIQSIEKAMKVVVKIAELVAR